jgi:hypothetical protein
MAERHEMHAKKSTRFFYAAVLAFFVSALTVDTHENFINGLEDSIGFDITYPLLVAAIVSTLISLGNALFVDSGRN